MIAAQKYIKGVERFQNQPDKGKNKADLHVEICL